MGDPENNLCTKIQEENKWSSVFPVDEAFNKVKLSVELIDRIFNEYHFKDLKKTSGHKAIIKHIYNAYFSKTVIGSKTKDKKNYTLTVNEETRRMFDFGIKNLRVFEKVKVEGINFVDVFNDE